MTLIFRKASLSDIPLLIETAFVSKSTWGYPAEWMEMWRDDITVTDEFILENEVVKAFHKDTFVGYYILVDLGKKRWDLDAFWIVSDHFGKGYGKYIFHHVIDFLRQKKRKYWRW